MHLRDSLALAALALAALASPLAAANYGRELVLGETLTSGIDPSSDADDYVFEGATGWKVTVKVKAAKGTDLRPVLELVDPDGSVTTEGVKAKAGKTSASLSATLAEGGRFAARVRGASGTGGYSLSWSLKAPKNPAAKNIPLGSNTTTRFAFPARGGTLVSWTLKFKGDGSAQVAAVEDPDGGDAGWDPEDDEWVKRTLTSEAVKDWPLPADGPGGSWKLVVENKLGSSTASLSIKMKLPKAEKTTASLTLEEPVLDSISHSTSTCGVVVTLQGDDLGTSPRGVWFGPNAATGVAVTGGKTITCSVPAGTGLVDVVYVAADGQVAFLEDAFTFQDLPTVTGFEPTSGPNTGNIEMRIFGAGFLPSTLDLYSVLIGGVPASQVRVNDEGDTITCRIPSHVSGPKAVVLRNACGEEIPVPGTFTYGTGLFISSVRPEAVPAFGGVPVVIGGANFAATDTVSLDGVPIATTPVLFGSAVIAHRIEAENLPAHAPGKVDIRVQNASGAFVTKSPGLAYFSFSDATSGIPAATANDDWGGQSLAVADRNGDGTADWIIISQPDAIGTRPGTRVLLNNGTGVFTDVTATAMPAVTADENWGANTVLAGRLTEDNIPDLYLSRAGTGVYWPSGNWNEARMLAGNKFVDPWATLLFPDSSGKFTAPVVEGDASLLNITGFLTCNSTWACSGTKRGASVCYLYDYDFRSVSAAMGDLDGDFDADIVLVNDESLADFTGTSAGVWVSCDGYNKVDYQYYEAVGYGWATRILSSGSNGGLTDRTANVMETAATADEDMRAVAATVADLSGDFLNDILIVHDEGIDKNGSPQAAARVLLQKNTGSTVSYKLDTAFFPKPSSGTVDDFRGNAIASADLNNDFWRDAIVAVDGPPPLDAAFSTRIVLKDPVGGNGKNRTSQILTGVFPAGDDGRARVIVARDIDKDGDTDLLLGTPGDTGSGNRKTRFLLNLGTDEATGDPIFMDASELLPPVATDPGNAVDIKLADIDGDNDLDIVLTDTHVSSGTVKRTRIWKQDR